MATPVSTSTDELRLTARQLRPSHQLPPDADNLAGVSGQDRAREAIDFGLRMAGYHTVVSGTSASGRNELVRELVGQSASDREPAPDWVYIHNFQDARRPHIVSMPSGAGASLSQGMESVLEACRSALPAAFADESYEQRVEQALEPNNRAKKDALEELQQFSNEQGFAVNPTPAGLAPVALGADGHPMSGEVFAALSKEDQHAIEVKAERVQERINATVRTLRHLEVEARERVRKVDREIAALVVGPALHDLREQFRGYGLEGHFNAIEADIVDHTDAFKRFAGAGPDDLPPQLVEERTGILHRYRINVFVTHPDASGQGAPIVDERDPSYHNLFGRIEFESRFGTLSTDFLHVRAGAIHLANGGFLILQLPDLLADARSWQRLKHALKTGEARMDNVGEQFGIPVMGLVPMPMPLSLKVILVGPPWLVSLLDSLDSDFGELFKIRAQFEPDMPAGDESVSTYAAFIRSNAKRCDLKPFDAGAVREALKFGNRLAGRQDRLSTRLGLVADLCAEANQFAIDANASEVTADHVTAAAAFRQRRSGLVPDRIRRLISEGTLHVETEGRVVGQVNGLAVLVTGDHAFGLPTRITCRTGAGQQGVVDIERETERSGSIHTKGVLVLNGYLMGTFGREEPLAFNASLTFEQSYDEVEGDSASSAELYAILTALAEAPVRQDVAVTGSVDQFGNIQAVGGVTEKVEGFYDVCREAGLTNTQGVIVPATNVRNLVLREDVLDAIEQGQFHLWAIHRIEQGLEILTGIPTSEAPTEVGETLFARVNSALDRLRKAAARNSGHRAGGAT